ncbi:1-acyl-sn-glycerol-3-phosphate acyltransferase [Alcanivorax sp. JB21]|uniref:lysophospholipid acyltransferase family protein n=1 Tax=Alcanivorax limicola TaxID=2874102 RepID=UPI001CBDC637|nr:lysophospholipid acyltransferase family protein [Alcanivorax limicola]MBZ2189757.1 1-acyl-sn-glycerol-3-phosphate acyltransferase [Alcanivorax limicola]
MPHKPCTVNDDLPLDARSAIAAPLLRGRLWPQLRRLGRLVRVVMHILGGLWLAFRIDAVRRPHQPRVRVAAREWAAQLLRILHVDIHWQGGLPAPGTFLVSNHVSWLDIPVLAARGDIHFLSKAEVRQWPLVGRLALAAGTLFIRRGSGESAQKAGEIAAHLREGRSICVFPEGTTTDGTGVRRFFRQLFDAPLQAGATVQPLAIRYLTEEGAADKQVAFIGDDVFQRHLWQLLLRDRVHVSVVNADPLSPDQYDDADTLSRAAHAAVTALVRYPAMSHR